MKTFVFFITVLVNNYVFAQNVGIGTSSPQVRLDIVGANGWDLVGGEGDIRLGTSLYRLKFGVALDGGGAGAVGLMQYGAVGGYNALALGSQGKNLITIYGNNSVVELANVVGGKVGIGTNAPFSPLTFNNNLGEKISLYGTSTNNYGFGITGGTLQIHSDAVGSDIAFGYGNSGTFTEKFRMKGNGAFVVNGSAGSPGQVLQSNGTSSATWVAPTNYLYNNIIQLVPTAEVIPANNTSTLIPGLSHTYSTSGNCKVIVSFTIAVYANSCFACGGSRPYLEIYVDGGRVFSTVEDIGNATAHTFSGSYIVSTGPGTHTIELRALHILGPEVRYAWATPAYNNLVLQFIPQ